MITNGYNTYDFVGLSSDDKNSIQGLVNGCKFKEMDTGKIFLYDAVSHTWIEQPKSGGGTGTTVIANPTLSGDEEELTSLQVENTKYKIPEGGSSSGGCYLHQVRLQMNHTFDEEEETIVMDYSLNFNVYSSNSNLITINDLVNPTGKFVDKCFPVMYANAESTFSYFNATYTPLEGEEETTNVYDTTMQIRFLFDANSDAVLGELVWSEVFLDEETGNPKLEQDATSLFFNTNFYDYVTVTDIVTEM